MYVLHQGIVPLSQDGERLMPKVQNPNLHGCGRQAAACLGTVDETH